MDSGIVSQCGAINCTYNQQQQCTAGGVSINSLDEFAQCYTYTEEPEFIQHDRLEVGDVFQCEVIDCIYNEGERCTASSITVNTIASLAQCVTYSTSNGSAN